MTVNLATTATASRGSPRLTIVIPTVNRASLLGRAVDSALAQTYPELEIIVSDNGSTDGTRAVLDRYDDPRLTVVHLRETIPASAHGNLLIERARGEYFLGLSDDDWIEPDFAAKVIALWDRLPDLAFVWTGCLLHYEDVIVPAKIGPEVESGAEFLAAFLAGRRDVCWCACVTRTADLRRIGPIPEGTICGDMFYWTKLASEGPVGCVREPVSHYVWYRDGGDGMSGGVPVTTWAVETKRWATEILEALERVGVPSRTIEAARCDAVEFVARSSANQFAWNALRGASRASLLGTTPACFRFLRGGHLKNWIPVVASVTVPRWLLRNRLLAEAERKARAAGVQRP